MRSIKRWLPWACGLVGFVLSLVMADFHGPLSASTIIQSAYRLIENNGTPLPQRTIINCSTGMTCTDFKGVTMMIATGTGGSVTSVACGTGLTCSPSPIVATGTISQTITSPAQTTWIPSAGCNNATAGNAWDLPTANAPAANCYGTSYRFGALDYDDAANETANLTVYLPAGWTGNVDANIEAFVNGTTQSVKATIATVCIPVNSDMLNPTLNAAQTITVTSPGTANQRFLFTQAAVTTTGCAAGNRMVFQIGRDVTDTSTLTYSITGVQLTFRVTPQA